LDSFHLVPRMGKWCKAVLDCIIYYETTYQLIQYLPFSHYDQGD
jgi:hypothetical protein